jgi:hypothetical protein
MTSAEQPYLILAARYKTVSSLIGVSPTPQIIERREKQERCGWVKPKPVCQIASSNGPTQGTCVIESRRGPRNDT